MYIQNRNRLTDIENTLMFYQKGKGMEEKIRSLGLTDTLLYIK